MSVCVYVCVRVCACMCVWACVCMTLDLREKSQIISFCYELSPFIVRASRFTRPRSVFFSFFLTFGFHSFPSQTCSEGRNWMRVCICLGHTFSLKYMWNTHTRTHTHTHAHTRTHTHTHAPTHTHAAANYPSALVLMKESWLCRITDDPSPPKWVRCWMCWLSGVVYNARFSELIIKHNCWLNCWMNAWNLPIASLSFKPFFFS